MAYVHHLQNDQTNTNKAQTDQWGYDISEDCLYLNVVRPAGYDGKKLPVAFWIHGGGYFMGGAGDARYNLSFIVQNGVDIGKPFIAVSTNYRLSAWGFLNGDDVQESGNTNLGLRDQRLALQWVQENIAAFGGNPKKVSIFGESAGGSSVGFHITAYGGRDDGLFRGAIMESGSPVYYQPLYDSANFQTRYDSVLKQTGCTDAADSLDCLRALPWETLNTVINTTALINWGPTIDYDFIQGQTSKQLANGQFPKIPIIIGANSDEGASFGPKGIDNETSFTNYLLGKSAPPLCTTTPTNVFPLQPTRSPPTSPRPSSKPTPTSRPRASPPPPLSASCPPTSATARPRVPSTGAAPPTPATRTSSPTAASRASAGPSTA